MFGCSYLQILERHQPHQWHSPPAPVWASAAVWVSWPSGGKKQPALIFFLFLACVYFHATVFQLISQRSLTAEAPWICIMLCKTDHFLQYGKVSSDWIIYIFQHISTYRSVLVMSYYNSFHPLHEHHYLASMLQQLLGWHKWTLSKLIAGFGKSGLLGVWPCTKKPVQRTPAKQLAATSSINMLHQNTCKPIFLGDKDENFCIKSGFNCHCVDIR